jgi:dihydrofolate reductase
MIISAIAAIGEKRELGAKNQLLWHIPGELARFKQITTGHPIIMGRKTHESIGRVLPNRTNIIISRDQEYKVEGAIVVHSFEEAIEVAKTNPPRPVGHPSAGGDRETFSPPLEGEGGGLPENQDFHEIFIIGGGQIFTEALPMVQKLYLTIVHKSFPEADVFFPEYEKEFTKVVSREEGFSDQFKYTFLTVER